MPHRKYDFNDNDFNNNHFIEVQQGSRGKTPSQIAQDIKIFNHRGSVPTDIDIHNDFYNNVDTLLEAQCILDALFNFSSIDFDNNTMAITLDKKSVIPLAYEYCLAQQFNNNYHKRLLFLLILRCYVDYNLYSRGNGCRRILMQIVLLFSCKFSRNFHQNIAIINCQDACNSIYVYADTRNETPEVRAERIEEINGLYTDFINNNYQL